MDNMHPAMAQALQGFAPPAESAEMAKYRKALKTFDWNFEGCDDFSVWSRANDALKELRAMQQALDPDGSIWLAVYPGGWCQPKPVVKDND